MLFWILPSDRLQFFSGYAEDVQKESWKVADTRTYVHYAKKKYNVMIFWDASSISLW